MASAADGTSATAAPRAADWPNPAYAWYVVALLVVAYAFAVVDRIAIGLLVGPMKADLGISDTEMGLLQGFAFAVFYTFFGFPMGVLVDRWKRARLLALGVAFWSSATVACGLAKSYAGLFAARVGVGAGESTVTPASSSLIADLFPPEKRSKAYGVFMVGGSIGTGMAYLLGSTAISLAQEVRAAFPSLLGAFRDWQIVFIVIGLPGLLLSLLILLTVREPERRDRSGSGDGRTSPRQVWLHMKANGMAYAALMLGTVLNVMVVNAQLAWFPSLFTRVHGWSAAEIGTALGLIGFPCGTFSALSAGVVMSRLAKRGRVDGPILVVMLQAVVWGVFGTLKCLTPNTDVALLSHVMTSLFAIWSVTAALNGLNQITPNEMRGQVIAVYTLLTGLVGVTFGPLVVGVLSDHVFTGATGLQPSLAAMYFFGGFLGVALLLLGRRAYGDAVDRARAWATAA